MPKLPENLREFDDTDKTRELIYKNTLDAIKNRFPVEDDDYSLQLLNPRYSGPRAFTLEQQKQALMKNRNLRTPIKGTWRLIHKPSKEIIDEREDIIMHVPYYTGRGTVIYNGNEYTIANQARLKPGAYVRKQRTGEIETHFNIKLGTGKSFHVQLKPESGIFHINVGQSRIPIYSLLKALGINDQELMKTWGPELLEANIKKSDPRALQKLYKRFSGYSYDPEFSPEQQAQYLVDAFPKAEVNPDVMTHTLGMPNVTGVTPQVLLRATQKMLNVSKKEEEPDDRDAPMYSNILSIEDYIQERIDKDAGNVSRGLLNKARYRRNLKPIRSGALSPYVYDPERGLLLSSGLAMCYDKDTLVLTRRGFIPWPQVTMDDEFACKMDGYLSYHKAKQLTTEYYDGPMYSCWTRRFSYLVTPNHRCYCRLPGHGKYGKFKFIPANKLYQKGANFVATLDSLSSISNMPITITGKINHWTPNKKHWQTSKSYTIDPKLWAEFLGWYIAEGWVNKNKDKAYDYRISIAQDRSAHPKECQKIQTVLKKLPFHFRYHKGGRFEINDKILHNELQQYGTYAYNKRIPRYLFNYDTDVLQEFFDAYMAGDGNYYNGYMKASTTSPGLALDLIELAGRLNMRGLCSINNKTKYNPKWRKEYVITFSKLQFPSVRSTAAARTTGRPNPWSIIPYRGFVYCATVPGSLLYVLRDGKPHWSGNSLEETNPLSTLEQLHRITKLGQGGISSVDSITESARDVNPGQFGIIDPICGPEDTKIGIDTRAAYRTFKGNDRELYAEFRDSKSDKLAYLKPADIASKAVAFPYEMAKPGTTAMIMQNGKISRIPKKDVELEVPSFGHMFSPNVNLNPMPTGVQPGRQFYNAKFWSQYLPQLHGEVPLVDSLMEDGKNTFSEYYGRRIGTFKSKVGGMVTLVTDKGVTVTDDNGKKHVTELVKNFPFNRLSAISYFPTVTKGDKVAVGDMLAHSNFTDSKTGALNLGINLKTAIIPASGNTFDDAYLISESAAKKLATDRLYGYDQESRHDVKLNKNNYISLFPDQFTKEQIETIDKDGIVKPGTIVHKDDPLILAVGPKLLTSADAQLGKLHKVLRNAHIDKASVWEHTFPGTVVDVALTQTGAKVNVRTTPPVQVGDKLSTGGLKGVVACYDDQTEVFTDHGWISWCDIDKSYRFACLINNHGEFHYSEKLVDYNYEGELIHAYNEQLDYCVTPNHRMHCRIEHYRGKKAKYRIREASEIEHKSVIHLCAAEFDWTSDGDSKFDLRKYVDYNPTKERKKSICTFRLNDVAEFLGWYLSEGCISYYEGYGIGAQGNHVRSYKILLSQSRTANPVNCAKIETLLSNMNLKWYYHGMQYTFGSKPWFMLLKPLGKSGTKRIPMWVWSWPKRALHRLFEALIAGDGHWTRHKSCRDSFVYTSTSLGLCEDVERLATLLGYNVIIKPRSNDDHAQRWQAEGNAKTELGQSTATFEHIDYKGKVYCAQVPGGLMYIRRNGRPMWCGNSLIPDAQMPRDIATNQPYELLLNPMGILSRVAPNQVIMIALAKLAKATGKQIRLPQNPPSEGWVSWAQKQLESAGLKDNTDIFDPESGKTIKNIGDGYTYVSAFHHIAEKKLSSRGEQGAYTVDEQPAKGPGGEAKRMSSMDINALLAHGSKAILKDAILIRGARNEDFWKALKMGRPLPEPKVPFIYDKFLNTLKAGGINIQEKGDTLSLLPMTDGDIKLLSKGAINPKNPGEYITPDFEPIAGGLFDVGKTGGMAGNRWTHADLVEPLPNPVMEEPIRRMLGLTVQSMRDIIAGTEKIDGITGGRGLKKALEKIDIDKMISEQKANVFKLRGTGRDNAVKILGYLTAAKKQGIHPAQWIITKVPILPPIFRPVSRLGSIPLVSDMNDLYRDLLSSNSAIQPLRGELPEAELAEEKLNLYDSVKAVYGLGESITPKGKSKRLKGAVRQIIGTSPKLGLFQHKVISKTVSGVGRGVITPDPSLDMDNIGIPEDAAWNIYKDFVIRRLHRHGYPTLQAAEMIDKRTPEAKEMLDAEMAARPVIVDRAPTWHKFNLLSFYPHLVDDDTIHVCPLITSGFGADFDGDQMNFHVPVSDKAMEEAKEKMLPSQNLFSLTDLKSIRHAPSKEMTIGLWQLTKEPSRKQPVVFKTVADAEHAYKEGKIKVNDPITVLEE